MILLLASLKILRLSHTVRINFPTNLLRDT
jgi:hypothetical protein